MKFAREGAGRSASAWILLALTTLSVGAVIGVLAAPPPAPAALQVTAVAGSVPVVVEPFTDERSVEMIVEVGEPINIAIARGGTVTATNCAPGGSWSSGDVPLTVDDVPVVALATDHPLWRDLVWGEEGDDVAALQRELRRLGYQPSENGAYDAATRSAVSEFLEARGFDYTTTLSRDSYLWLPQTSVTIAECHVGLGAAVSPGTVARSRPNPIKISPKDVPIHLAPGGRELVVGDTALPLSQTLEMEDAQILSKLSATAEYANFLESEGSAPFTAIARLTAPIEAAVLPPSSIIVESESEACVAHDDQRYRLEILSSELGRTIVSFSDQAPSEVDLSPRAQSCR